MESLRSSLIAAERAARQNAQPARASVDESNRSGRWGRIAGIAIATLAVTNIVTWHALVSERVARQEAEQERRPQAVQNPSTRALGAGQWIALRQVASGTIPGRVVAAAQAATASPIMGDVVNTAVLSARLAKRLVDPKAHDALRDQQKGSALQLYGELLKRWHLSHEATAPILEALAEHELRQLASVLAGDSNAANTNAADDVAIQAALTAKQLEDLRAYDTSLPDRMTIAPFLTQLQLESTPLSSDSVERLVNIMHDERVAVPPPEAPVRPQSTSAYAEAMAAWQAGLDQRVRDRAALILSPDLLSRLESFQTSQRAANSVFASLGPEPAPPPPATTTGSGSN